MWIFCEFDPGAIRHTQSKLQNGFLGIHPSRLINYFILFVIFSLTTSTTATTYDIPLPKLPTSCPNGFILLPKGDSCYGFQVGAPLENTQTWTEANNSCSRDGGSLLFINDKDTTSTTLVFLRQRASQLGVPSAWVAKSSLALPKESGAPVSIFDVQSICTYVDFPENSSEVRLNSVGCNSEKRNFICQIHIAPPIGQALPFTTTAVAATPKGHQRRSNRLFDLFDAAYSGAAHGYDDLDANPVQPAQQQPQPESVQPPQRQEPVVQEGGTPVQTQKTPKKKHKHKHRAPPPSTREVNMWIPNNMPGVSKIQPVRTAEMIRARHAVLVEMFGSSGITRGMQNNFLPIELETANVSAAGLDTARMLLLELAAEAASKKKRGDHTQMAKALTLELLEEGHPIRCHYGIDEKARVVSCVTRDSQIESCLKQVSKSKQILRSCGLPGVTMPGCHRTIDGTICFCTKDLCNSARTQRLTSFTPSLFLVYQLFLLLRFIHP